MFQPDERYGHSREHELIHRYVVEGITRLERFGSDWPHPRILYDMENLSDGSARWSCQKGQQGPEGDWAQYHCPEELVNSDAPFFTTPVPEPGHEMRAKMERQSGRYDVVFSPVIRPRGQHGIYNAQPFRTFDADTWLVNYTLRFLGTAGRAADIVPGCDCSAQSLGNWALRDAPISPADGLNGSCNETDLKLCSDTCADAWRIPAPVAANCL